MNWSPFPSPDRATVSPVAEHRAGLRPARGATTRQVVTQVNRSKAPKCPPPTGSGLWECWKCRVVYPLTKASVDGEGTGYMQPSNFPESQRATCRDRMDSESTEPLRGRLGAPAQRRHRV